MYFSYTCAACPTPESHVFVLDGQTGLPKTPSPISVLGWALGSVALADLDGDNAHDLIVSANQGSSTCTLAAYHWDGTPVPGWETPLSYTCHHYVDPVVADADGDGRYEILAGVYLWNHDGTLAAGWPNADISATNGAIAELGDADPQREAVVGWAGYGIVKVVQHDGSVLFITFRSYGENHTVNLIGENTTPGNPIVADIDGDTAPEIVKPARVGFGLTGCPPLPLYATEGLVAATPSRFPRFVPDRWGAIRSTATVGDLDGDGLTDLAVGGNGKLWVWGLGTPFDPAAHPWPVFQHDAEHTGRISLPSTTSTSVTSSTATTSSTSTSSSTSTTTSTSTTSTCPPCVAGTCPSGPHAGMSCTTDADCCP
jgi:hypothetical protein